MMYVARMFSETMEWVALGNTEEEAKNAILTEWNEKQRRLENYRWERGYDGEESYYYDDVEALEEDYDIAVFKLMPGTCEAW